MTSIDLNADLGEGSPGEAALFASVSSVNIACGGHAGDDATMIAALRAAKAAGVAAGAHPGYEDREHFGRRELALAAAEIEDLVARQVARLARLAMNEGIVLRHVKPHGALYNQAARDRVVAAAVVRGIMRATTSAGIFAPSASELAQAAARAGLPVWPEGFADRGYLADGRLAPRGGPGAVLGEADALAQGLTIVREGRVRAISGEWLPCPARTLCVHGDGPDAAALLGALRAALVADGFAINAPSWA